MTVEWAVEERETGLVCASGSAPTSDAAHREVTRYAIQYAQDGPIRFWIRRGKTYLIRAALGSGTSPGARFASEHS